MTKIFSFQLKFFLLQRIFGDIFLNNYLDFPETNPIVQYLKFDSETLYDYSKIRFFFSVCNFLVHDKCLKSTTNPCVSVAATIVKVSWGSITVFRRFAEIFIFYCRTLWPTAGRRRSLSRGSSVMFAVRRCMRCRGFAAKVSSVGRWLYLSILSSVIYYSRRNLSKIVYVSKQLMINAA